MNSFSELITEIRQNILSFYLFNNLLTTLVVFLFSYLVFSVFTFHPYYSLFPAIIYFVVSTYVRMRQNLITEVEEKFPELNEKLRTAAQYSGLSNPVVDDLKKNVLSEAGTIKTANFFHTARVTIKVILSIFFCFLIIFTSLLDQHFFDIKYYLQSQIDKIPDAIKEQINSIGKGGGETNVLQLLDEDDRAGTLSNRDIYGDKKLAKLGDEIVNMEMQGLNFKLSMDEKQELLREEFEESFPSDIYAEGSSAFKETISLNDQEVVKRYFKSLARG
jgi:hypothetical protein